jgi:Leucine-rich repeat (LRR) protein
VGQDCWKIPPVLVQMYGTKVQFLDLSFNCLTTLQGVEMFPNLEELVLDNNKLSDSVLVPQLPNLHILSLNKNNVSHVNNVYIELIYNVPLTYDHFTLLSKMIICSLYNLGSFPGKGRE